LINKLFWSAVTAVFWPEAASGPASLAVPFPGLGCLSPRTS